MAIEQYRCNTFEEFGDAIVKASEAWGENCYLEVYGNYDEIKEVLIQLIKHNVQIGCILELEHYAVSHYSREFVLGYVGGEVAVEKAWYEDDDGNGRYYMADPDIAFVFDDCSSKILKNIDSDHVIETSVGAEEYEEDSFWHGTQKIYNKQNKAEDSEKDKKPEAEKSEAQKKSDKEAKKETEDVSEEKPKEPEHERIIIIRNAPNTTWDKWNLPPIWTDSKTWGYDPWWWTGPWA